MRTESRYSRLVHYHSHTCLTVVARRLSAIEPKGLLVIANSDEKFLRTLLIICYRDEPSEDLFVTTSGLTRVIEAGRDDRVVLGKESEGEGIADVGLDVLGLEREFTLSANCDVDGLLLMIVGGGQEQKGKKSCCDSGG